MNAHLLFKFQYFPWNNSTVEGVTIDKHKEIIKKFGKVWWGRTSGISQEKAETLKHQLSDGIPTYVFLYSIGVPKKISPDLILWYRARLIDLTLGKPETIDLIPEYYREKDLALYCLITDIQPLECEHGKTPRVPGQAANRHVGLTGEPLPENLVSLEEPERSLCTHSKTLRVAENDLEAVLGASEQARENTANVEGEQLALKVISLQEELIELKDEIGHLRTYKEFYNKILNTDYLFSSEKFFENWIQDNIHRIFPEFEILDRQPCASWPDGKFGRLDLLAVNKESKDLVIIEVKTRKRSKRSGYDQFLRYTSWARRNIELLRAKFESYKLQPTNDPQFVIITDYVDDEMRAICKDHGITLVHIFGGLGIERAA